MEAYHPNQNPYERHGSVLKVATSHLLLVTGAPLNFWCYTLEYIALLQSVIAHRNLNWDTPHTLHFGDTPDRSMMLPGRFIGIAHHMCFVFLLLYTTMTLTTVKSLHAQSFSIATHRNHLRQWMLVSITV